MNTRILNIFFIVLSLFCESCVWNEPENSAEYLPLDDSEYPYAGLPRLVIETEDFQQIRDRETETPARLQVYGKDQPEGGILDLTVKGHGFSSFVGMPKPSYKIEFFNKLSLLGMHKDKDWVLIANSADRSLLRNFITYKLYDWLGADYSPHAQFVELFFNRQYQGVYLLTETVKVGKHRVNICESPSCFLFEKAKYTQPKDVHFRTRQGNLFLVKSSNKENPQSVAILKNHIDSLEAFLAGDKKAGMDQWFDIETFVRFYWTQEFSKNLDGNFYKSIFLTWRQNSPVQFGPVWDFDMGYGNSNSKSALSPEDWYIRPSPWNRDIIADSVVMERVENFWLEKHQVFEQVSDTLLHYSEKLSLAAKNEFTRWPTLSENINWANGKAFHSYGEAVDNLNDWIKKRIAWIDNNLKGPATPQKQ